MFRRRGNSCQVSDKGYHGAGTIIRTPARERNKRGRLLSFEQALDLAENTLRGHRA